MPDADHDPGSSASRALRPLQEFLSSSTAGAAALLVAVVLALIWANSPLRDTYSELWGRELVLGVGRWAIRDDLRHWVNEALMTLFFLLAGLEIKRELTSGVLRDRRTAALPVLAALGGMAVPALLFLAINAGSAGQRGWGMAMPTDLALVLGVLALASPRAPTTLKAFVVSLAIADDVGTIVAVLVAYADGWHLGWAAVAGGILLAVVVLRRNHVRWVPAYIALGVALWIAMRAAGLNPTMAGVAMGLLAPPTPVDGPARAEHVLLPWVNFVVLPLFALANAGIVVSVGPFRDAAGLRLILGLTFARLIGKMLGIVGVAWIAVRLGVGRLPAGLTWSHLAGVAAVAGIGFTVSLFVGELAFSGTSSGTPLAEAATTGVLVSSVVGGLVGWLVLRSGRRALRSG
jgi:NhaA family Na+:H+ antiporter